MNRINGSPMMMRSVFSSSSNTSGISIILNIKQRIRSIG
jgi:hypothetical protein